MLFTSIDFWLLFAVTFAASIAAKRPRALKAITLVASLVFYAAGDQSGILVLIGIASLAFFGGMYASPERSNAIRKISVWLSIGGGLLTLAYFKYLRFLLEDVFPFLLSPQQTEGLLREISLPLGISFFTFQSLSYTFDVYRGRAKVCRNYSDFLLYVTFFPQIIAGPIERFNHLFPQIQNLKLCSIQQMKTPLLLIAMAFFKKIFVANSIGPTALLIFQSSETRPLEMVLAGWTMAMQVYFDFSAYSDFALGLAALFGVQLTANFRPIWFATNPLAFWERWNVTTGKWFRDYLLVPMGGNGDNRIQAARNIIIMFMAIGLWHGASWNWIVWGLFQGLIVAFYRDLKKYSNAVSKTPAWVGLLFLQVFMLPISGLLHFADSQSIMKRMLEALSGNRFSWLDFSGLTVFVPHLAAFILPGILFDVFQEKTKNHELPWHQLVFLISLLLGFSAFLSKGISNQAFIYFGF
ncbi:MAG: MBOAT family protein [Deltaproteobacteria bacterium]|jgi:alginate O-acetyltransferase complex protein AlgI|nr:MBOAT family protein [Deltaproteobacteria bacterium]